MTKRWLRKAKGKRQYCSVRKLKIMEMECREKKKWQAQEYTEGINCGVVTIEEM